MTLQKQKNQNKQTNKNQQEKQKLELVHLNLTWPSMYGMVRVVPDPETVPNKMPEWSCPIIQIRAA